MNLFSLAKSQRGQMTMEMMLLLAILVGAMMSVSSMAREQEWMKKLVSGPWKPLQGMIEDGVWNGSESKKDHPSMKYRHGSYNGDDVP